MGGGLFAVKVVTLHLPVCILQGTSRSAGYYLNVLAITDPTRLCGVIWLYGNISARCVCLLNIWVCAFSGLHGLATGLESHHAGSKCPIEGLPGAGEQAAGGQPAAGGSNNRLGHPEHLSLTWLVPAGTDCQWAPCPGQTQFYWDV